MELDSTKELGVVIDKAYRQGFLDCLQAYAYQSGDGFQVGNNGITLKEAIRNLDDGAYFNPASAHKVVEAYLKTLRDRLNKTQAEKTMASFDLLKTVGLEAIQRMREEIAASTNEAHCALLKHRISIVERTLSGEINSRQAINEAFISSGGGA